MQERLKTAAETMECLASDADKLLENPDVAVWRNMLMGLEGAAVAHSEGGSTRAALVLRSGRPGFTGDR